MDTERAYEVILQEVAATSRVQLGECEYDTMAFGSFIVRYRALFRTGAFINDRGQIFHDPDDGELLVEHLGSTDEQALIDAVRSKLR